MGGLRGREEDRVELPFHLLRRKALKQSQFPQSFRCEELPPGLVGDAIQKGNLSHEHQSLLKRRRLTSGLLQKRGLKIIQNLAGVPILKEIRGGCLLFVLVGKKVLQASTLLLVLQILGGDHVDAAPFQGDLEALGTHQGSRKSSHGNPKAQLSGKCRESAARDHFCLMILFKMMIMSFSFWPISSQICILERCRQRISCRQSRRIESGSLGTWSA